MPTIPGAFQSAPRTQANGIVSPGGAIGIQPRAFGINDDGARAAAGLERAAAEATQKVEIVQREQQQEERVAERGRVQAALLTRSTELRDQVEQVGDPEGMRAAWTEGRQRLRDEILASVPARERAWAEGFIGVQLAQDDGMVNRLVRTRVREAGVASLNDELAALARVADAERSPEGRARAIAAAEAALAMRADTGIIGRDDAQRLRQRFAGQMEFTALNRLVGDSPGAGLAVVRDASRNQNLSPEQRLQLEDRAQAGILRQAQMAAAAAARAEAAAQAHERRARIAVSQVDGFLQRGILPPAERLAQVAGAVRGTEMEAPFRAAVEAGRVNATFATLPPDQQVARLTEARARLNTATATEADLRQFDNLQRAAAAQAQDYRQNPWQRAVQDGVIPAVPPLDLNDPASFNARVQAAQQIGTARGITVPALTTEETQGLAQRFAAGDDAARNRILATVNAIEDPAVRTQTVQALERARGDAGRMPAGSLPLIGALQSSTDPTQAMAGRRLMALTSADTSDRAKAIGESAELSAALATVQTSGPQAVLGRAARELVGSSYANFLDRDMATIRRAAASLMAQGETSATRAVTEATRLVNAGRQAIGIESLAYAVVPREVNLPAVETGMRALRAETVAAWGQGRTGQQAQVAAGAVQSARWFNEGDGYSNFVLVGIGANGVPVPLRRATLQELTAARPAARSTAPVPPGERRTGRVLPTAPLPAETE